jgi:hypothetical protein
VTVVSEQGEPADGGGGGATSGGRGSGRLLAVAVGVVAVLVAAGAGFALGTRIGGGGTQPEDVLPSTMVVYSDIDLDPSASQKVNLARLLGQFPDIKAKYGSEPDVRQLLIDQAVKGSPLENADVESWVGDRIGGGLNWNPDDNQMAAVVAIQVTDEDAARADLEKVLDDSQLAFSDGYAVISSSIMPSFTDVGGGVGGGVGQGEPPAQDLVDQAQDASLADAEKFQNVFNNLDDGWATLYVDGQTIDEASKQLTEALGGNDPLLGGGFGSMSPGIAPNFQSGQVGAVVRAEPDAIEMVAWNTAPVPDWASSPVSMVQQLPASTVFAVGFTGGATAVAQRWDTLLAQAKQSGGGRQVERELAQIEAQYGIRLPDDLETILGSQTVFMVDGQNLLSSVPGIGLRSVTNSDDAAAVVDQLQSALSTLTGGFGVTAKTTDDGLVVASTPDLASTLASEGSSDAGSSQSGQLGDDPDFQNAVPDADQASAVAWLDLGAITGLAQLAAPDEAGVLAPLSGLGVSVSPADGGTQLRARLVFNSSSDS